MEKEVLVQKTFCDICENETEAQYKCIFCGKDMCYYHSAKLIISPGSSYEHTCYVCYDCLPEDAKEKWKMGKFLRK